MFSTTYTLLLLCIIPFSALLSTTIVTILSRSTCKLLITNDRLQSIDVNRDILTDCLSFVCLSLGKRYSHVTLFYLLPSTDSGLESTGLGFRFALGTGFRRLNAMSCRVASSICSTVDVSLSMIRVRTISARCVWVIGIGLDDLRALGRDW